MNATFKKHKLQFKFNAGTSRGVLKEKNTCFLKLLNPKNEISGFGECGPLVGLSIDDIDYGDELQAFCKSIEANKDFNFEAILGSIPVNRPALKFAFETAWYDLKNGGTKTIFRNDFSSGKEKISINGLVWMGKPDFMKQQIRAKIEEGYNCIKIKIGAIDFEEELKLLKMIRSEFSKDQMIIRVDANEAFTPKEAFEKLSRMKDLDIHSIEQPIKRNQWVKMNELVASDLIPIALDEELIQPRTFEEKNELLRSMQPQYIILKPTLLGGFNSCDEWIKAAEENNISWWITSALESNIGLNAICQYTYEKGATGHQGLGTGQLYHNNIDSPLTIERGHIFIDQTKAWDASVFDH
ncbi:MAG: o-succinylbenzoate synthase [Bacteroidota bacterium]